MATDLVRLSDVMNIEQEGRINSLVETVKVSDRWVQPDITIENQQQAMDVADSLVVASKTMRALDDLRSDLKRPLIEKGRNIDRAFKAPIEACQERIDRLGRLIKTWRDRERLRVERENKERLELAEQTRTQAMDNARVEALEAGLTKQDAQEYGKLVAADVAPPPPQTVERKVTGSLGTVSTRKVWKHLVTDVHQVPWNFMRVDPEKVKPDHWKLLTTPRHVDHPDSLPVDILMVDADLLKAAVKAGVREIPGVRIYQDEINVTGRG